MVLFDTCSCPHGDMDHGLKVYKPNLMIMKGYYRYKSETRQKKYISICRKQSFAKQLTLCLCL